MKTENGQKNSKTEKQPPAPGTKEWYRRMRREYWIMWLLPVAPLGYVLLSQHTDHRWEVLAGMLTPVILSGVGLVCIVHALWRIEVNVAGNRQRPFTKKDHDVLARANSVSVAMLAASVVLGFVTDLGFGYTAKEQRVADTGTNTAIIVAFATVILVSTMARIHCKARHAYEELEKGV